MSRAVAAATYGTAGGRKAIRPPIPQWHPPGASPERVAELAAMPWPDLVAYCDRVLDRLVDAMLLTRDDTRRAA